MFAPPLAVFNIKMNSKVLTQFTRQFLSEDLRTYGAKIPDFQDGVGLGSLWWSSEDSRIGERRLWLSGPEWTGNQGWGKGLMVDREGAGTLACITVRLAFESKGEDAFVEDADLIFPPLLTVSSSHIQRHTQLLRGWLCC